MTLQDIIPYWHSPLVFQMTSWQIEVREVVQLNMKFLCLT